MNWRLNKLLDNPENYIKTIKINYAFFILLFCIYSYIQPLINYKVYYSSNKYLHEEQTLCISENMITISTKVENIIIKKEYINKIGFDKKRIYVYKSNNSAEIIPLRFCKDEKEFNEIKRIVYQFYDPRYLMKTRNRNAKKSSNNCFNLSIPFVMKLASGFAWQVSRQSLRAGIAG